jgi:hypothetical protein
LLQTTSLRQLVRRLFNTPIAFSAIHAKAKPIPSAAQIALADPEVQQDFLNLFACVRFPTDFPQTEVQREERLFTFYNKGGKTAIKGAVCLISLICLVLGDIWVDPSQEYYDVQQELAGLPVSIVTRLSLILDTRPSDSAERRLSGNCCCSSAAFFPVRVAISSSK